MRPGHPSYGHGFLINTHTHTHTLSLSLCVCLSLDQRIEGERAKSGIRVQRLFWPGQPSLARSCHEGRPRGDRTAIRKPHLELAS